MSVQVENLEKNMAKMTIEVPAEDFEKAIQAAYVKNKNRFNVPGFRKGKVPRNLIEKMYGAGVFYEEAFNSVAPDAYDKAAEESGLKIVSRPEINVVSMGAGQPVVFTAEVAVKPEVTLGEYKGLEAEKAKTRVTKDEVLAEIKKEQEKNATQVVVDRPIEKDDIAIIDFEGFVDGVAFDGGKGEGFPLTIGSGQFIPGFEDQLIGAKTGDDVEVNVTFPTPYQAKELEGKDAVFKVKIQEVKAKEYPELDDEFASEVSEFETLEEYKDDVKKKISERKKAEAKRKKEDALVEKAVENAEMEIPAAMVRTQAENMMEDFRMRIQQQGMSLAQYMQFTGMNQAKMMAEMSEQAQKRISTRLVLEAIARAENITATDEEIDKEIEEMAKAYNMEADRMRSYLGEMEKKQMAEDIAVQKAVDFLVENCVEV